jgi:hypothetical protein
MGVNVCVGVGVTFGARASSPPTLLLYSSSHLPERTHAHKYLRDGCGVINPVGYTLTEQYYFEIRNNLNSFSKLNFYIFAAITKTASVV